MRADSSALRIAVVHDYVTQRGGAERVALALLRCFPEALLYTTVFEPNRTFSEFTSHTVVTSRLNRVPAFRRDPRLALPLLQHAISTLEIPDDIDAVVCSSSGWAHGVTTRVPKIVYCHNPARWLYQTSDYFAGLPPIGRLAVAPLQRRLKRWDVRAAHTASAYIANSSVVARRIAHTYEIDAEVIPPPVTLAEHATLDQVPGLIPGYYLTVARNRGYKHASEVRRAFVRLPRERLVVVGGSPGSPTANNIWEIGQCTDAQLRWLYANCVAVISVSHEDFGLTPLEGNAFGRPVIALRAGGYLDTVVEGVTGVLIDTPTAEAIQQGIDSLLGIDFSREQLTRHAEQFAFPQFKQKIWNAVSRSVSGGRVDVWKLRT